MNPDMLRRKTYKHFQQKAEMTSKKFLVMSPLKSLHEKKIKTFQDHISKMVASDNSLRNRFDESKEEDTILYFDLNGPLERVPEPQRFNNTAVRKASVPRNPQPHTYNDQ